MKGGDFHSEAYTYLKKFFIKTFITFIFNLAAAAWEKKNVLSLTFTA